MTALDEFLSQVREREARATEGPWEPHDNHGVRYVSNGKGGKFAAFDSRICEASFNLNHPPVVANIEFIAHSRADIPRLLKIVEELRGALKELERPYLGYTPGEMPRLPDVVIREALRRSDEIAKEGEG